MVEWTNQVPDAPRGHALPIRRTPAARSLEAIVTSPDLIGCYTHYWKGSTHPCEGKNCPACAEGQPYRWHAYMTAVDAFSNLHMIFECTAIAAEFFTAYRSKYSTLRGCYFQARRWNNRPNGRILIRTKPADLDKMALPEPPDLKKCMAILWSLPADDVQTPFFDRQTDMPIISPTKKPEQNQ